MKREPSQEKRLGVYKPGSAHMEAYTYSRKGEACFLNLKSRQVTDWKIKSWFEEGAIVECMYMLLGMNPLWWKPLKRRYDKTHPNNRRTFYRTIVNIKENIKMKEFLDCRP